MDLKENPKERRKQVEPILMDSKSDPETIVKLYDGWNKYYEQVSTEIL